MSALVSSWSRTVHSVPEDYVFPENKRPGSDIAAPVCKDIPVIDLSQLDGLDRVEKIQQIMKANRDLGIFQVINHGVSEELLDETMNLFKEFFSMPAEDKAMHYSEDGNKGFRLYTSIFNTKTYLSLLLNYGCREVVGSYTGEVRKLSSRILDLICEGLGIGMRYFEGELSKLQELVVHHYPPCPDPSLVLGVGGHSDPHLLTLLQQEDICGLQIYKDGRWLGVEPIPHAFVIMISDQLEVINHGVSEELMDDTMSLFKEFFDMAVEDKAAYYSEDMTKSFRLYTGDMNYLKDQVNYWRIQSSTTLATL
ncbi:hypothetical protein RHMOL_Rhmol01G0352500 [Rhododendron molle]|uniref:Uncharacterized protein n=1 Tax=Rhododendron molle TaxID=49168 RepID=A0ACC0QAP5_RHOML|nr:hypothetical protein RHMOL_Rhmol01G0352500 [Rhododendron molle]